jgi:hypothetical protein
MSKEAAPATRMLICRRARWRHLPVARQAGSKGPVRRLMADPQRKTVAEKLLAIGGTRGDGDVRKN